MTTYLPSFAKRSARGGIAIISALTALTGLLSGQVQAQQLRFEQSFETTAGSVPVISYTGAITTPVAGNVTGNGSPNNALYYSQAAGTTAWALVNGGTGAASQTLVLRNIRFASGSTSNAVEFLLAALSNNPNNGITLADKVQVDISTDYGQSYYPVAVITGNNNATNGNNGFSSGVVWSYQGNTKAPGSLTASATFNGADPSATPTTFTPALVQTISANTNDNNLTGAGGYGRVSIAITNATNVQMRITMTNSLNQQVWGIDQFRVFSSSAALPVELTHFDAAAKMHSVSVNWATASEKNSDRFEVQRSTNSLDFETIGTVKAQGTSSQARGYEFVDRQPLAGPAYYRLRQVDADGTAAFSPVAAASALLSTTASVYPNPSAGFVLLPADLGTVNYRVMNTIGQTLLSGQATSQDRLDLTTLPKGSFLLELSGASGRTTQRLVRE